MILESLGEEREVPLEALSFREVRRGGDLVALEIAGETVPVRVARSGDRVFVRCAGQVFEFRRAAQLRPGGRRGVATDASAGLIAPMPGRIRRTLVEAGQEIAKGDVVLVLEAMKMEHAIRAPHDGVVTRMEHREGDLVEAGAVLAEIR